MDRSVITPSSNFVPYQSKFFKHGGPHPGVVVEASSLAYASPPQCTYTLYLLSLPDIVEGDQLSKVQLEAIQYACQKHEQMIPSGERAGFFLGDSTGLGKGRIIAGIILENVLKGRPTSVWITVSSDLFQDCAADFRAVDDNRLKGIPWNYKSQSQKWSQMPIFSNHTLLVTYSTLTSNGGECLKQLIEFLQGIKFVGPIIFDECHKGKSAHQSKRGGAKRKDSKVGEMVLKLQHDLPDARIVYVSATGASSPWEMTYMTRLGLWGQGSGFQNVDEFILKMQTRGMSSMEALAVNLKQSGAYISRQISMFGVEFEVVKIELEPEYEQLFEDCAKLFQEIYALMIETNSKMGGIFWAAHQAFFANLCTSSKIKTAAEFGRLQEQSGNSVVFGIQKTGEARYKDVLQSGESFDDFSSAKCIIECLLKKLFAWAPNSKEEEGSEDEQEQLTHSSAKKSKMDHTIKHLITTKPTKCNRIIDDDKPGPSRLAHIPPIKIKLKVLAAEKLDKIVSQFKELEERLPTNPLDKLIHVLGGSEHVAEMTGRTHRLSESKGEEETRVEARKGHTTDRKTNLQEKLSFQLGIKTFAIISDAASTGISLHALPGILPVRRRIHVTLEHPWSADKMVQQLGRTHRTGQAVPPKYVFLCSDIPGEERFIHTIQQRLMSMNAVTKGDRNAAQNVTSTNIVDADIRASALKQFFDCLCNKIPYPFPLGFEKELLNTAKAALVKLGVGSIQVTSGSSTMSYIPPDQPVTTVKFLNRVLGMPISDQKFIVNLYYKFVDHVVEVALKNKMHNPGIEELTFPAGARAYQETVIDIPKTSPIISLHLIEVDYGLKWISAELIRAATGGRFYKWEGTDNTAVYLVLREDCRILACSPNNLVKRRITETELANWIPIDEKEAAGIWATQMEETDASEFKCIHLFLDGECGKSGCKLDRRTEEIIIITRDINAGWSIISSVSNGEPKIVRVLLTDGSAIVGVVLEYDDDVMEKLQEDLEKHLKQRLKQKM